MNSVATSDLIFDPIKTLSIIELDKDLLDIFKDDVKTDIPLLKTMCQEDMLPKKVEKLLESIFNGVILFKQSHKELYASQVESAKVTKKRKALPRRYGKVQIQNDITKAGGKATDLQRAMLAINELRNLYVNMTNRCITDYFNENKNLSDAECRDIKAAVESIKKKFKPLLSKK